MNHKKIIFTLFLCAVLSVRAGLCANQPFCQPREIEEFNLQSVPRGGNHANNCAVLSVTPRKSSPINIDTLLNTPRNWEQRTPLRVTSFPRIEETLEPKIQPPKYLPLFQPRTGYSTREVPVLPHNQCVEPPVKPASMDTRFRNLNQLSLAPPFEKAFPDRHVIRPRSNDLANLNPTEIREQNKRSYPFLYEKENDIDAKQARTDFSTHVAKQKPRSGRRQKSPVEKPNSSFNMLFPKNFHASPSISREQFSYVMPPYVPRRRNIPENPNIQYFPLQEPSEPFKLHTYPFEEPQAHHPSIHSPQSFGEFGSMNRRNAF